MCNTMCNTACTAVRTTEWATVWTTEATTCFPSSGGSLASTDWVAVPRVWSWTVSEDHSEYMVARDCCSSYNTTLTTGLEEEREDGLWSDLNPGISISYSLLT